MSDKQAQKLVHDADQVEFKSMQFGSAVVDAGSYDERIADANDDYTFQDGIDRPQWQEEDLTLDSFVGGIHEEINRRIDLMGNSYPFKLNQNNLQYKGAGQGFYEFLLSICNTNDFSGKYKYLPVLFERTTNKIIAE